MSTSCFETRKQSSEQLIQGQQELRTNQKIKERLTSSFYQDSNKESVSLTCSSQMISPINRPQYFSNSPTNRLIQKDLIQFNFDSNDPVNTDDQKYSGFSPASKAGMKMSEYLRLSPAKNTQNQFGFMSCPNSLRNIKLARTFSKYSQQDESLQSPTLKSRVENSKSQYFGDESRLNNVQSSQSIKIDSPFNQEEMQMKIEYCEKVNFEKMDRHLLYMKNNNVLKKILNDQKKKVSPSTHVNQYFNQLSKNKSQHMNTSDVQFTQSLHNSSLNMQTQQTEKFFNANRSYSNNQVLGGNQFAPLQIDKQMQQEFTRLEYLNQIQKQMKNISQTNYNNNSLQQSFLPQNTKSLASLVNSSPQGVEQMKFLQKTKKISPAHFFQNLFHKKQQTQIKEASQKLNQFQSQISLNRQNISLDWQQKLLMRNQNFLDNVNKQNNSGSALDKFIENKYFDTNQRNANEIIKNEEQQVSPKNNNLIDIKSDQTDSILEDYSIQGFSNTQPKWQKGFKQNTYLKNSFLNSPILSHKVSSGDLINKSNFKI